MNVVELQAELPKLEERILGLLQNFTEQTGLVVTDIYIDLVETTTYDNAMYGRETYAYKLPKVTARL